MNTEFRLQSWRPIRWFTASFVLLFLGSVAMPAYAQIEEIVVTATKRAENVQEVPIAVTAFGAEQLDRSGFDSVRDLQRMSTSFNMNTSDTESQGATMRIRGIGTTGNNIGLESAVGVFLDGVYLSRPGIALGDLMDLERVEVLRGPQGTLFGRNTTAGAINIITRAPRLDGSEGFANIEGGNFDARRVQAGVSFPIIQDKLGFRISGSYRQRDGYVESPPVRQRQLQPRSHDS